MDVGGFQETKLTDGIYTHGSARYSVIATLALSRHHGSVALFYPNFPNFTVKAIHQFHANIIACQLATGERCCYIIRCYLELVDGDMVQGL